MWIQVWHIPAHWSSIETGRKIGNKLGEVKDIRLIEAGGTDEHVLKILAVLDLTKPLQRGTKLKYRQFERWVEFRYEKLPIFCFYCGLIGHNERLCLKRGKDVECGCVSTDQFGYWLKAGPRKLAGWGVRKESINMESASPPVTKRPEEIKSTTHDLDVGGMSAKDKGALGGRRV